MIMQWDISMKQNHTGSVKLNANIIELPKLNLLLKRLWSKQEKLLIKNEETRYSKRTTQSSWFYIYIHFTRYEDTGEGSKIQTQSTWRSQVQW